MDACQHHTLERAVASAIGKQLARRYGGDLASTDWSHLGRLADFTNQKPQRRSRRGHAPWVKLRYAHAAWWRAAPLCSTRPNVVCLAHRSAWTPGPIPNADTVGSTAVHIYADWLHRLRIPELFPQPDWSIADMWIAKELLRQGTPAPPVADILRAGSPGWRDPWLRPL